MMRAIAALAGIIVIAAEIDVRAACAAPALQAYGALPHVEQIDISPSGERLAMIRITGDARQLVIASVSGGATTVVNFEGKGKLRSLTWAGDDHVVVTASATFHTGFDSNQTEELSEALVYPLNKYPSFAVFAHEDGLFHMVAGVYGFAKVDNRWYGYFGGLTPNYQQIPYQVDLDTGKIAPVRVGNGGAAGFLLGPDGKVLAHSDYFAKTGAWQINEGVTGDIILKGRSPIGGPGFAGLGREPGTILIYNSDPGVASYQTLSLKGGPPTFVPDGDKITSALPDGETGLWMGEVLEGDTPKTVLFSPERQAKMNAVVKAFAKYAVRLIAYDNAFNRFIVHTDGGDDSGTYWLVDSAKHTVESVGQAYPDVKEADVGPVRIVDWKAADGLEEHGVLTLPPGRAAHDLPVVVLPHGGPQQRDYPGFDWWAQAFASRGYAVFQPNFRGSAGYGDGFVRAGHGQWGRKMQTDISDGLAAVAAQGLVDLKRACIVGGSYGGYAALAGVTIQHDLFRCAVSVAGVSDLRRMLKFEDERTGFVGANATLRYWKEFMGAGSLSDDRLDDISPAKLADHATAPILLIHGKDDAVVPFTQSLEMQTALARAGKPVEFVTLPGEDHWLSRPETRTAMLTAAVAFVQKYNPAD